MGLCTEMLTIFSVVSSKAVSALPFRSSTVNLFRAENTVSASGCVLICTVKRLGTIHAREMLTSIQTGMLEIFNSSRCEHGKPSLYALDTLLGSLQKPRKLKKEYDPMTAARQLTLKACQSTSIVRSASLVLLSAILMSN